MTTAAASPAQQLQMQIDALRESTLALNKAQLDNAQASAKMGSGFGSTILGALGLSAAFSILTGGVNDASSAGLVLSSSMYGLQVSLFELQHAVVRAWTPIISRLASVGSTVADVFVKLDQLTGGVSTIIATLAAPFLVPRIWRWGNAIFAAIQRAIRGTAQWVRHLRQVQALFRWLASPLPGGGIRIPRLTPGAIGPDVLPGGDIYNEFVRRVEQSQLANAQVGDRVPRLTQGTPRVYQNINHFNVTATDPDDFTRRVRLIVESGGLDFTNVPRTPGRGGD